MGLDTLTQTSHHLVFVSLGLLQGATRCHKLGIEVVSWYQNITNLKACKVCNEGMVEDECHLLFTCSAYSARSRYVDILRGSVNLSAILKTPPRRLSSYVYALFTHKDFVLQCMNEYLF